MDGGPYRTPRSVDRRVASRPEPTHRQPDAPQSAPEVPPPLAHHATPSHHSTTPPTSPKRWWRLVVVVIIVITLCVGGWFGWSRLHGTIGIESNKYQAVFFTNGQVYFGKLHVLNGNYLKLTDIYYLQTQSDSAGDSENPQKTASKQNNNVQLIKLGSEIHGPEDEMIIARDQVLFFENLKPKGKVSQTIEQSKSNGDF